MKTQIQTQTITLSKGITIIKCCVIALIIACLISAGDKVSAREFVNNILEWESI
jgi:hypothetical protein